MRCTRGANLFFCPPDVVFISDDHVINATSLIHSPMVNGAEPWFPLPCIPQSTGKTSKSPIPYLKQQLLHVLRLVHHNTVILVVPDVVFLEGIGEVGQPGVLLRLQLSQWRGRGWCGGGGASGGAGHLPWLGEVAGHLLVNVLDNLLDLVAGPRAGQSILVASGEPVLGPAKTLYQTLHSTEY